MSRFGLLAGTAQADVDPTQVTWHLNTTGWVLVLLPFLVFIIGSVIGASKRAQIEGAGATATADMFH